MHESSVPIPGIFIASDWALSLRRMKRWRIHRVSDHGRSRIMFPGMVSAYYMETNILKQQRDIHHAHDSSVTT
jgi:hypothetical protein